MDLERILIIQPVERIVKFEPRITVKSSDTDLTKNWTRALQLKLGTVDEQSATWNIMRFCLSSPSGSRTSTEITIGKRMELIVNIITETMNIDSQK